MSLAARLRLWKSLEIVAGCLALAVWLGAMSLWMYYDATRPPLPDPGAGRIYAQNTHGSIVYLSRAESLWVTVLMSAGGVCMAAAVAIDLVFKPFRSRWESRAGPP